MDYDISNYEQDSFTESKVTSQKPDIFRIHDFKLYGNQEVEWAEF